jgi:homocysteine S-methyltransferase
VHLSRPTPWLLAGAVGTTLRARGYELRAPLFAAGASLEARSLLDQLHADSVDAGADVLATNTFTLTVDACAEAGVEVQEIVDAAVASARRAGPPLVVGSIGPVSTDPAQLRPIVDALVAARVDAILAETVHELPNLRAALAATRDAAAPVWLSVAANARGNMLDGTSLQTVSEMLHENVTLLAANCFSLEHSAAVASSLAQASGASRLPWGIWPHASRRDEDGSWNEDALGPDAFAREAERWFARVPRPTLIGSCCGTTPRWTAALRDVIDALPPSPT